MPTTALLRVCLGLSGASGATGVICLALSAHVSSSTHLATAGQMLLAHAPLLLGIGVLSQVRTVPLLPIAAASLSLGLMLFSGDLIARTVLEQKLFPMSAPIGGLLIILGWLVMGFGALRVKPK